MQTITIIESLDFGQALLSDGNILKADGTIITQAEYAKLNERQAKNKLDWTDLPNDEMISLFQGASWIAKTIDDQANAPEIEKQTYAGIDSEGTPFYINTQNFLGADTNSIAEIDYGKLIYHIRTNRPDLIDELTEFIEDMFGTTEQIGSEFSPDDDTIYKTKIFIKDRYSWKMIFKNGELSNIKQHQKLHHEAEVQTKASELKNSIAREIATGSFDIR